MRRLITWFGTGTAVMVLLSFAVARAGEEKAVVEEEIAIDKVPKLVLDAVKARFKGAEVTGAAKEMDGGKLVYELSLKDKGKKIDVILTPEGAIVLFEKEIAREDLPKPVAKALEDKYAKATYKIVEEVIKNEEKKEKLAFYEVLLVTADKKMLAVHVSTEGKILVEEDKDTDPDLKK
jgi:hypothetical protein